MGCDSPCAPELICHCHFNPRTHMGCDRHKHTLRPHPVHFNPRTHMGCDVQRHGSDHKEVISIHAPTWGATSCYFLHFIPLHFNPRTHMGCDNDCPNLRRQLHKFQSTHPHGVRRLLRIHRMVLNTISIHAPTWGATRMAADRLDEDEKFQSTHPHGVRQ